MANPITCDMAENHAGDELPTLAAYLVNNLGEAETYGLCGPCFVEMCIAIARQAESQKPEPEPAQATDDTDDPDSDEDEAAVTRLELVNGTTEGGATSPTVVRRGTSRSRKAYEARKRQKGEQQGGLDSHQATDQAEPAANVGG